MNDDVFNRSASGETSSLRGNLPPEFVLSNIRHSYASQDDLMKWNKLVEAIQDAGGVTHILDNPEDDGSMSRETYTRDLYTIVTGKDGSRVAFIPSLDESEFNRFMEAVDGDEEYRITREDIVEMRDFLISQGIEVVEVEGAWFQGGNIHIHEGDEQNTIFVGIEPGWDEKSGHRLLDAVKERFPDQEWRLQGLSLNIDNPEIYHLDLMMSNRLPNGEYAVFMDNLPEYEQKRLRDIIGSDKIIPITAEMAKSDYATNFIVVNDTIILTGNSPEMVSLLQQRGYTNIVQPQDYGLDSFEIASGGVRCMTNRVNYGFEDRAPGRSFVPTIQQ